MKWRDSYLGQGPSFAPKVTTLDHLALLTNNEYISSLKVIKVGQISLNWMNKPMSVVNVSALHSPEVKLAHIRYF